MQVLCNSCAWQHHPLTHRLKVMQCRGAGPWARPATLRCRQNMLDPPPLCVSLSVMRIVLKWDWPPILSKRCPYPCDWPPILPKSGLSHGTGHPFCTLSPVSRTIHFKISIFNNYSGHWPLILEWPVQWGWPLFSIQKRPVRWDWLLIFLL